MTTTFPLIDRVSGWLLARRWLILILLVAAVALGLRLQGLDWDGGRFYHPDERSIYMRADCMYLTLADAPGAESCQNHDFPRDTLGFPSLSTFFDKDASPLNPHWFPLGTIIIYMLVAIRFALEPFMDQVRLQDLATIGRTLAALADTGSVIMIFFLGRRLYSPGIGLLAAILTAFTVINIQVTHFYRPESFVVLLALAAFWWMLNVLQRGRVRDHVGLGLVIGATFAFRGSSLPMLAPVGLTYLALLWRHVQLGKPVWSGIREVARPALTAFVSSIAVFLLLQPYALLDYQKYVGDLAWEAGIARTAGLVPYTVQYVGTPRYGVYELQQTALWALGLPLGILAWGGLVATVVAALRRPALRDWLLLAWVLTLLVGIVPLFEVKFLRYVMPVLPVMVLLGSRWLVELYKECKRRSVVLQRLVAFLTITLVFATVFYALAFVGIYSRAHPGIQASAWMNEHAESGAIVLTDNHWDEGFAGLHRFRVTQLPMYESDTLIKASRVSNQLAAADYVMSYSNRPWGSIARLPERYPYSAAYYRALFDGELGYELVRGFARYPNLAGVSFAHNPFDRAGVQRPAEIPGVEQPRLTLTLGYADENVVNYDHPLVLVWQNTGSLSSAEIQAILLAGDAGASERALLSDTAAATQRAGGTWTEVFNQGGLNSSAPWLVWLLVLELVFVVSLPMGARLMRWLPDRGVVLARPLGLLVASWLVWFLASVGFWAFSRATVAIAIATVTAVSAVVLYRNRWLVGVARRRWRYMLAAEILFVVAYLSFVMIRAANPDLWHPWRGGEKPMDFTYLLAVVKSTTFPPFDPWYAGGFINYYYFGFVVVGSLIKLTGIVPEVAYNLAIPTLFAMTATAAFSIGYNIAQGLRDRGHIQRGPWSPVGAGIAVALLVAVLANIDGAVQLLQGAGRSLGEGSFGHFDFWRSSRLMPGQISITEFPFWTFLFADLHAHLIAIPFQLLVVGLSVNLVLGARSAGSLKRLLPSLGILAFVTGSLGAINTWDLPAYGLLALAALTITVLVRRKTAFHPMMFAMWGLLVCFFALVLYGAWVPFHQNYEAPFDGVRLSQWRTVFWHYLGIHALLLFATTSWLVVEFKRFVWDRRISLRQTPVATDVNGEAAARRPKQFRAFALSGIAGVLAIGLWFSLADLHQWTTVVVLMALTLVSIGLSSVWLGRRLDSRAPLQLLLLAALVLALGIGMGVDFITAERDIDRMNTVFKLYLNAWILFGVVGGTGLWYLWAIGATSIRGSGRAAPAKAVWLTVLALLVLASAVYPVLGTRARLADRFDTNIGLTLDGTAYQRVAVYGDPGPSNDVRDDRHYPLAADAEAIEFIRHNVEGSPVFLEGVTDHAYRWYPRVAKYAGNPVIVGWRWHQVQQRGAGGSEPQAVDERIRDVAMMYNTSNPETFLTLAGEYGVQYVYIGPTEQSYFDVAGLDKFGDMIGAGIEVFFKNEEVTIYRLSQDR